MAAPKARIEEILPVDQLREILDDVGSEMLDDLGDQGMKRLGNMLEAKAVELCPVLTGNLEDSSQVITRGRRGGILSVEVRFNADYAMDVHELPEERRGPKTRQKPGNEYGPAGPKYLERPLRGFQLKLARDLGAFVQKLWGRKTKR